MGTRYTVGSVVVYHRPGTSIIGFMGRLPTAWIDLKEHGAELYEVFNTLSHEILDQPLDEAAAAQRASALLSEEAADYREASLLLEAVDGATVADKCRTLLLQLARKKSE